MKKWHQTEISQKVLPAVYGVWEDVYVQNGSEIMKETHIPVEGTECSSVAMINHGIRFFHKSRDQ